MEYTKMKKMANKPVQWLKRSRDLVLGLLIVTVIPVAHGALPTVAPPTSGVDDGDYFGMMKGYFSQGLELGGLVLISIGFLVVVKNIIIAYSEVMDKQGTWRAVMVNAGAGVLLLVGAVYMLTDSVDILK